MNIFEKPRFINSMPDSAGIGNILDIQNSLKASLGDRNKTRNDLDEDVAAASKRILLHDIEFRPASAPYSIQRDNLRAKYIALNPTVGPKAGTGMSPQQQQGAGIASAAHADKNGESLPSPKVVLYPEEKVRMEWSRVTRIGAGLVNMGNTCFFNSTLQCLTYTAPLVNYCFTSDHREKCKKKDFCMMCEVQNHIKTSLDCGGRSIKPHSMLQKLRCIAKHMKWGRQEDAHEFLRFLVDRLQQSCMNGETKLDRFSKETTIINQIFGGYLRSQVTCLRCQAKSNTFDPFMDLSLDIKGVNSVEDALQKYFKPETLENENAYKCPKCKNKVRAQKRFTIQKTPNVLTLQLNRFNFNGHFSGKINRFIRYPEKINLRNYMSQKQGEPDLFHLYGIVVHSGHSSDHGHYYSYVKSPSKMWYCMNDSSVHQVNTQSVFGADAYVLFYARINKPVNNNNNMTHPGQNNMHVKNATPVKGPYPSPMMGNRLRQEKSPVMNGIHGKSTSEMGTPIKRQEPAGSLFSPSVVSNGPKIVPHATSPSMLPGSHSKISFPILTPQQKKQHQQQQQQRDDGKQHIVLQIKHGNSTTMVKSPDGKSKMVNNGDSDSLTSSKHSGLVPYNDDSDSDQENTRHSGSNSSGLVKRQNPRTIEVPGASSVPDSSRVKPSGDYNYDNHISVSSIPLPSDCGDGPHHNEKTHPKNVTPLVHKPSVLCPTPVLPSDKGSSHNSHHKVLHNGTPQANRPRLKDSLSTTPNPSPLNSLASSSKRNDAQGSSSTPSISSSSSLQGQSAAGKGGVMGLELPPVVHVSSSSSYTPTCSAKVKTASGNWLVQPQDCAPSPRGSCSSTNSVNSTTEWTVESKGCSNGHVPKLSKSDLENSFARRLFTPTPHKCDKMDNTKYTADTEPPSLPQKSEKSKEKQDAPKKALFRQNSPPPPSKKHSSESERPRTPVDIPDTRSLLMSPSSSTNSDCGLSKKVKKHKKKQKHRDDELKRRDSEEQRDDSSSRSDSSRKKKHKHKKTKSSEKHKKKFRKDSDSSDSDSSGLKRHKYKKHKHSKLAGDSSDSSQASKGWHKLGSKGSHSGDESEHEWVEKTKESLSQSPKCHPKGKVSVQSWNHHIKDDLAPRKNGDHPKFFAQWDGSRVPKVSRDLGGSSQSLGNVLSWDGKKNHIDRELEEERLNKKRHWSEEYNEELDSGKVKKIKQKNEDNGFSSRNPFQHHQSMKQGDKFRDVPTSSWSQDHSYHQRQDNHNHQRQDNHNHRQDNHYQRQDNHNHRQDNHYQRQDNHNHQRQDNHYHQRQDNHYHKKSPSFSQHRRYNDHHSYNKFSNNNNNNSRFKPYHSQSSY